MLLFKYNLMLIVLVMYAMETFVIVNAGEDCEREMKENILIKNSELLHVWQCGITLFAENPTKYLKNPISGLLAEQCDNFQFSGYTESFLRYLSTIHKFDEKKIWNPFQWCKEIEIEDSKCGKAMKDNKFISNSSLLHIWECSIKLFTFKSEKYLKKPIPEDYMVQCIRSQFSDLTESYLRYISTIHTFNEKDIIKPFQWCKEIEIADSKCGMDMKENRFIVNSALIHMWECGIKLFTEKPEKYLKKPRPGDYVVQCVHSQFSGLTESYLRYLSTIHTFNEKKILTPFQWCIEFKSDGQNKIQQELMLI